MNEGTRPRGWVDRLLALNAWVVYLFFYAPIVLLIVFSFNDNNNVGIWTQPSLRWYGEMFQDERVMGALRNSLIVAFFATIVSTVLGTMLAIALERYRFRGRGTLDGIAYLPIIIPDVTMAVMLLIFFFQAFGMLDDALGNQSVCRTSHHHPRPHRLLHLLRRRSWSAPVSPSSTAPSRRRRPISTPTAGRPFVR